MQDPSPAAVKLRTVRRAGRAAPVLAALGLAGFGLAGCSNNAQALAQAACVHVDRSLSEYHQAMRATGGSAHRDAEKALAQLQLALPLAAAATSADGSWNPLQTTLQLSNRTPESNLIGALQRQCAVATNQKTGHPATPVTTPPTTTTSPS